MTVLRWKSFIAKGGSHKFCVDNEDIPRFPYPRLLGRIKEICEGLGREGTTDADKDIEENS